ncbi:uncharacterized protein LOC134275277 [Saccostrea cucullata]|uniref:uncharacterized protein LOC134275277 n=1 Tax=Saccostrea cuccullata TaxID=36930 RepID=UPI002ED033C0
MFLKSLVHLLYTVSIVSGYENLSRRNTTFVSQSSDYTNRYAKYGIDGNTTRKENSCAHTAVNKSEAWFQVDLGEPFSLQTIRIVYRDEGIGNWRPYRFRYFYLDVSNSSIKGSSETERIRCYKDNTTLPSIPPSIINVAASNVMENVGRPDTVMSAIHIFGGITVIIPV